MINKSKMYPKVKTWNPFVGCNYNCIYCKPSFQQQLKRVSGIINCDKCYNYEPHYHPERLNRIPSKEIIFVCGDGDISFCSTDYIKEIITSIKEHNKKDRLSKSYYFQSKNPITFKRFIHDLPNNAILITTLETNRDEGYKEISEATLPTKRYKDFLELEYDKKVVTIEPVMDFDLDIFDNWIVNINPLYVWFGFNSRPKRVSIPEPSIEKAKIFIDRLKNNNIEVRGKELRGIKL